MAAFAVKEAEANAKMDRMRKELDEQQKQTNETIADLRKELEAAKNKEDGLNASLSSRLDISEPIMAGKNAKMKEIGQRVQQAIKKALAAQLEDVEALMDRKDAQVACIPCSLCTQKGRRRWHWMCDRGLTAEGKNSASL